MGREGLVCQGIRVGMREWMSKPSKTVTNEVIPTRSVFVLCVSVKTNIFHTRSAPSEIFNMMPLE